MTEDALCFDCDTEFNPHLAFQDNQGCPNCDADLRRLFDQRDGEPKPDPESVEIRTNHDGSVEVTPNV